MFLSYDNLSYYSYSLPQYFQCHSHCALYSLFAILNMCLIYIYIFYVIKHSYLEETLSKTKREKPLNTLNDCKITQYLFSLSNRQ